MNPFQDQRIVGAAALTSFAAAILLANASGTAAPNSDSTLKLPSRLATPAAIVIRSNPFVAFTVPHTGTVVNGNGPNLAGGGVPGPNQIINAPGRPGQFVPPPGGSAPSIVAPAEVLLCDTWTAKPGTNQTPTAVFMVGRSSVIATAGDLVGGYRVSKISDGIVRFDTGDSLALGDCQTLDTSTTGNDGGDDAEGDAAAPAPTNTPPMLTPGTRIVPIGGNVGPVPYGTGNPAPRPTNVATPGAYGASGDEEYGSTIYGKPAPTSAPYPIAIPNGR
jgi:hypothetical protein